MKQLLAGLGFMGGCLLLTSACIIYPLLGKVVLGLIFGYVVLVLAYFIGEALVGR